MTPQGGPDGWRFARVQWAKGIYASRRLHYFLNRVALCGEHRDGVSGWYTEVFENFTYLQMGWRCKRCLKELEKARVYHH